MILHGRLDQLDDLRKRPFGPFKALVENTPDPPDCYYSKLDDICRASIAAIDILVATIDSDKGESAPKFKKPDMEKILEKHQGRIQEIAEGLNESIARFPSIDDLSDAIAKADEGLYRPGGDDPPEPAKQASQTDKPPSKDDRRAEWIGKALMLRKANPNMPKAEIARQVGVHPGQLSPKRFPELAEREKMLRGDVTGGHLTKDSETGLSDVEAPTPTGDKPDQGKQIPGSKFFREYCAECGEPMRVTREQIGTRPRCEDCAE